MSKSEIFPYQRFRGALCPQWLLVRKEIPTTAKLVYARLVQYQGVHRRPVFPAHTTLAHELGCSVTAVRSSLKTLQAKGLIVSEATRTVNVYRFLDHEWIEDWRGDAPPEAEEVKVSPATSKSGPRPKLLVEILKADEEENPEDDSREARMGRIREHTEAAKKSADIQAAKNAESRVKAEDKREARRESNPMPSQLEELWREECAAIAPDIHLPIWGKGKNSAIAKRLRELYKTRDLRTMFLYVIRNWLVIRRRYFKDTGADLPTLAVVERFHEGFHMEAVKWEKHRVTLEEFATWQNAHKGEFVIPPSDLRDRHEAAMEALKTLCIGEAKK
jgi:hypothetical protein